MIPLDIRVDRYLRTLGCRPRLVTDGCYKAKDAWRAGNELTPYKRVMGDKPDFYNRAWVLNTEHMAVPPPIDLNIQISFELHGKGMPKRVDMEAFPRVTRVKYSRMYNNKGTNHIISTFHTLLDLFMKQQVLFQNNKGRETELRNTTREILNRYAD